MHNYSLLDKILHHIALDAPFLGELIFDIEKNIFQPITGAQGALYVTGLARSGTTALLRGLYASGQFASLTYDDMPFPMAPNLWEKFSRLNTKMRATQERSHGDGIYIDFDSPEAFEEVFWRLHCGRAYIHQDALHLHCVEPETIGELHIYQKLICNKYGRQRYLAKNNNHIIRLASLAAQTKESTYLVVFRNPLDQAESLLKQHQHFLQAPRFTKKYMTWLAHHEFGATHRPFKFSEAQKIGGSPDQLDYWLQRWIDAYSYLLNIIEQNHSNIIAVSYERLCADFSYWSALCEKLDLPQISWPFRKPNHPGKRDIERPYLEPAMRIYRALEQLGRF